MNMNIDVTGALGIAGAVLGLSSLVAALFTMRAVRAWRARCLAVESNLAAVRRELEVVASVSLKAGRRVMRIEQAYSGVSERVDRVEFRGAAKSFDQAIDFARRGADSGKLTQQF